MRTKRKCPFNTQDDVYYTNLNNRQFNKIHSYPDFFEENNLELSGPVEERTQG